MSRRSWLIFFVSLATMLSLFAAGCTEKKGPSEQGRVLLDSEDDAYRVGYRSGFDSGASEGYGEASRGETFSPSLKKTWNGGYQRSLGYWRGFNEGYDYGWKTSKNGYARPKDADWYDTAVAEAKQGGNQDLEGYTFTDTEEGGGYKSGYNAGRKQALADSKAGRDYRENPTPSAVDRHCSGESERYTDGWIKGYRVGYRENYAADGYMMGYDEGKKQALADSEAGRDYQEEPSDGTVDRHCSGETDRYREGWIAGYKDGYRENWSAAEGSEYQAGFEQGYKKGLETGRLDKQAGYTYNDKPHGYYEGGGGEDYQEGFRNGYKKGYKEGYSEGDWEWDPDD